MARPSSIAIAGYYPTPAHLIPKIARLLSVGPSCEHLEVEFAIVDPCAGNGTAACDLAAALFDRERLVVNASVYAGEMEASRFMSLEAKRGRGFPSAHFHAVHGDAFRLTWSMKPTYGDDLRGANLLFLNPPYDLDPEHGRLEERFLARFTSCLAEAGVLVFVVPYYAMKASAQTLGANFRDLACVRFPDGDFEAFKQVVLIGTKRTLLEPDPSIVARVESWASNPAEIPEMGEEPVTTVPALKNAGFAKWEVAPADVAALVAKLKPWHSTDRGGRLHPIGGVVPPSGVRDLLARKYPLAMPPRAAHIAAGVAAGIFNGAKVGPDDSSSGLPEILVKGVFDREFVTIDERKNKDGDKTGEIQVQQPKLVVTVLDLGERRYHTVRSSPERTGATLVADMTTADLLAAYGRGLMRVMLAQCPVLHDPALAEHQVELPALPRPLYRAQGQAVMAAVKLLGGVHARRSERQGKSAFLLGAIGTGKTTVALATAHTIGAQRVLVMCPPHLLDSWRNETAAVLPWGRTVVLSSVADVDALASDRSEGTVVAILSREVAKLGHAWVGVGPSCPRCGDDVPPGDLAKTRATCPGRDRAAVDTIASAALELGLGLLPIAGDNPVVAQLFRGRHARRLVETYKARSSPGGWEALRRGPWLPALVLRLLKQEMADGGLEALALLLLAVGDDALMGEVARAIYRSTTTDPSPWGPAAKLRASARGLALLMLPGGEEQTVLEAELTSFALDADHGSSPWDRWRQARDAIAAGTAPRDYDYRAFGPGPSFNGFERGSVTGALAALQSLVRLGRWEWSGICGEPLYQAVPTPRRYPLATYVARRAPRLFDLLILDEAQEYAGDGSAQGFAAHRLSGLGIPTLMLTGSVMNGYAESLFANQWALDPKFRDEFSWGERREFVRRYGYLKQVVEDRDKDTGKVVEFGAVSDRVERKVRTIGNAPGVLPLFLLRHLLRLAVTLHKDDLDLELPGRQEVVERVEPSAEQKRVMDGLQTALVTQIKRDQFGPLAGKLWGQLAELPSYLDRATEDAGNRDDGSYVVAYPDGVVVASAAPLPAGTILPKEAWMLARIGAELGGGRNVLVFAWHTALLQRLARIVEVHLGERCPVLDARRVPAGKRQAWIDREVVCKKRRVLVVNPVAVQTGLNNLVSFSTQLWMENPACNAITYRQAAGRIDRIGQTRETRIVFPVYAGTSQEHLHRLLLHKVAVSMATDGLDPVAALQAAGVGETGGSSALAVGQQLYEMIAAQRRGKGLRHRAA